MKFFINCNGLLCEGCVRLGLLLFPVSAAPEHIPAGGASFPMRSRTAAKIFVMVFPLPLRKKPQAEIH